jgi:hypothetical protein
MKRRPIKLACHFEYCRIRPKEERRLALYRVSVGSTSVDDLVRDDGIHCFAVDGPGMNKGRKANHDREEDNSNRG